MGDVERESSALVERLRRDLLRRRELVAAVEPLLDDVARAASALSDGFRHGGKALLFGNGGSLADALHLEAELIGRFARERAPLPAITLGSSSPTLTALSNDYGYAAALARSLRALAAAGDVAIAFSTSGRSANVLEAVRAARDLGLRTIAFTGRGGGDLAPLAEIAIRVPFDDVRLVQEAHHLLVHLLAGAVEEAIANSDHAK